VVKVAGLKLGDRAVNFNLIGVDDKLHSLDEYANKHVAVIFSCNHCPYVRAWEDRMISIQADYANKGVQLIAINANDSSKYPEDDFPNMKERARLKRFNFPYLRDEDQTVAKSYSAQRTPEVFLFDAKKTLRYHGTIDDNYDEPNAVKVHYLRDAIDAILQGKNVKLAETQPVGCTIKWR
jgi:peroxiredoxin